MELQTTQKAFAIAKPQLQKLGISESNLILEIGFANMLLEKSEQLQQADSKSLAFAFVTCLKAGLTLNPDKGYCYLEPRWDSKAKASKAHLRLMYKGLNFLAVQDGVIEYNLTEVVYENDRFRYTPANVARPIEHEAAQLGQRGKVVGAYSLCKLPSGDFHAEVMEADELTAILRKSTSPAAKAYPKEFARKTVFKRHYKRLPNGSDRMATAIQADNDQLLEVAEVETKELPNIQAGSKEYAQVVAGRQKGLTWDRITQVYQVDTKTRVAIDAQIATK